MMTDESTMAGQEKDTSTGDAAGVQNSGTPLGGKPEGGAPAGEGTDPQNLKAAEGGEGGEGKGESGDSQGAPETYEQFKLPEGFTLEGARLEQVSAFAKENGWTQEQAQSAVDMYLKMRDEDFANLQTALTDKITEWEKETQSDPVLSKGNYKENEAKAVAAVSQVQAMMAADFGDNARNLADVFEETGVGSHPGLVQMFYSLANRLGEGKMHSGAPGSNGGAKSDSDVLYPNG